MFLFYLCQRQQFTPDIDQINDKLKGYYNMILNGVPFHQLVRMPSNVYQLIQTVTIDSKISDILSLFDQKYVNKAYDEIFKYSKLPFEHIKSTQPIKYLKKVIEIYNTMPNFDFNIYSEPFFSGYDLKGKIDEILKLFDQDDFTMEDILGVFGFKFAQICPILINFNNKVHSASDIKELTIKEILEDIFRIPSNNFDKFLKSSIKLISQKVSFNMNYQDIQDIFDSLYLFALDIYPKISSNSKNILLMAKDFSKSFHFDYAPDIAHLMKTIKSIIDKFNGVIKTTPNLDEFGIKVEKVTKTLTLISNFLEKSLTNGGFDFSEIDSSFKQIGASLIKFSNGESLMYVVNAVLAYLKKLFTHTSLKSIPDIHNIDFSKIIIRIKQFHSKPLLLVIDDIMEKGFLNVESVDSNLKSGFLYPLATTFIPVYAKSLLDTKITELPIPIDRNAFTLEYWKKPLSGIFGSNVNKIISGVEYWIKVFYNKAKINQNNAPAVNNYYNDVMDMLNTLKTKPAAEALFGTKHAKKIYDSLEWIKEEGITSFSLNEIAPYLPTEYVNLQYIFGMLSTVKFWKKSLPEMFQVIVDSSKEENEIIKAKVLNDRVIPLFDVPLFLSLINNSLSHLDKIADIIDSIYSIVKGGDFAAISSRAGELKSKLKELVKYLPIDSNEIISGLKFFSASVKEINLNKITLDTIMQFVDVNPQLVKNGLNVVGKALQKKFVSFKEVGSVFSENQAPEEANISEITSPVSTSSETAKAKKNSGGLLYGTIFGALAVVAVVVIIVIVYTFTTNNFNAILIVSIF